MMNPYEIERRIRTLTERIEDLEIKVASFEAFKEGFMQGFGMPPEKALKTIQELIDMNKVKTKNGTKPKTS